MLTWCFPPDWLLSLSVESILSHLSLPLCRLYSNSRPLSHQSWAGSRESQNIKVSKLDMFFICLLGGLYQNCDACTWSKQTRHRQLEHQQDYSWFIKHTVLIPSKSNWLYLQGPLWAIQTTPNAADFIR